MDEQIESTERRQERLPSSEEEWRQRLTPEQFEVLRNKGTEPPFTGKYAFTKDRGTYRCAACGAELFRSEAKYDSGTGWPSFFEPIARGAVELHEDVSFGMRRIEVTCARCGGHLGHLFDDGPEPTGERYCMNSISLSLEADDALRRMVDRANASGMKQEVARRTGGETGCSIACLIAAHAVQ